MEVFVSIKVYNVLTRKKEEFVPLEDGKVKMYACGITASGNAHIGHAFQACVFDMITKYLTYKGYDVTYVRNYTDIDDKIIDRARQLNMAPLDFAQEIMEKTDKELAALGVDRPTIQSKATECIGDIIQLIKILEDKGYAYRADSGDVFYKVSAFERYGSFSNRLLDNSIHGVRIEVDANKNDERDFALWKSAKEGEISWDSPWGKGRPGWHIECSAMAKCYLGDTIDIHAGGEDLVFPHHENEIAQSEGANGVPFAHYWMHNAFLNIDNEKMAKSKGNFKTLRDVGEQFGYDVVRFFMLNAHYRSPLNYSIELMESAKNGLERIKNSQHALQFAYEQSVVETLTDAEKDLLKELPVFEKRFNDYMSDDFNTADAISVIFELVKFANTYAKENASKEFTKSVLDLFNKFVTILGLIYEKDDQTLNGLSDTEILEWIEKRKEAKKAKDYKEADRIRDYLKEQGVLIEDTRNGVRYKRV